MAHKYPHTSPYCYAASNPVLFIDPNGDTVSIANDALRELVDALRKSNKYFAAQYDELNGSEVVYNVSFGTPEDEAEGQTTTTDGKQIEIILDHSGRKMASVESRLAHEFAHGQQFDRGELGFGQDLKGKWHAADYDISDEVKAYDAQVKCMTAYDEQKNAFFIQQYADKQTDKEKTALVKSLKAYRNLEDGPVNCQLSFSPRYFNHLSKRK